MPRVAERVGRLPHVPAMATHAARGEKRLRIVHHCRIPAEHHVRIFRRERDAGACLQPAVGDGVGNAPRERARMRLPAHHRHVGEGAGSITGNGRDFVTIGEFLGVTNRVHEDRAFEFLPRLGSAQDRQIGSDPRSCRQAPEHLGYRNLTGAEESVGLRRQPDRFAYRQRGQPRRQWPFRQDDEIELVRLRSRWVHERVRPADHRLLCPRRGRQGNPPELARDKADIGRADLERVQPLGPLPPAGDPAFNPLCHSRSFRHVQ